MFGWLQELIDAIVNAITGGFKSAANEVTNSIWNLMLKWLYNSVYSAIADFFTMMGNMGAEIFDLAWIQAIVKLFTLFGWGLFVAGVVVAVFDLAIEFQSGRANVKNTMLNILKGFFACSLIGIVPIELYKFCISLQNTFADELARIFSWESGIDFATRAGIILGNAFSPVMINNNILLNTLLLIAFAYCIIKVFFQNIKRGGILLVQMSVGSLYMFRTSRLFGRVYAMDETGCRAVSDGIYANDVIVCRADDVFGKYVVGAWNNACGKRSSENCSTVRA